MSNKIDEVIKKAANDVVVDLQKSIKESLEKYCNLYSYGYDSFIKSKDFKIETYPNCTIFYDGGITILKVVKYKGLLNKHEDCVSGCIIECSIKEYF